MTKHGWGIDPDIQTYLQALNGAEAPVLQRIRAETAQRRQGQMHIAPEQAKILCWLAQLLQAKHYLEVGVFTGYSSTSMALTLPENGRITACDISITYTDIARRYWQQAGVAHKIELYLQPALITLDELLAQGRHHHYDLALIDADKAPTAHYFERCLQLVRPGGVIAIDNTLLGGRVVPPPNAHSPPGVLAVRQLNAALATDARCTPLTLPVGDGLTLLLKR